MPRWWHDGHRAAVAVNLLATDLLDSSLPRRVGGIAGAGRTADRRPRPRDHRGHGRGRPDPVQAGHPEPDRFGHPASRSTTSAPGFSSISHLNDLAVGELKLDRTFTSRLQVEETAGRDEDIVRSIIDLGHALGLRVVAEGIERLDFVHVLAALGCDAGPGLRDSGSVPCGQHRLRRIARCSRRSAATCSPASSQQPTSSRPDDRAEGRAVGLSDTREWR